MSAPEQTPGQVHSHSYSSRQILLSTLGSSLAIGLIGGLCMLSGSPLLLGSFGASCVMVFVLPHLPFAQPRVLLIGHLMSSLIGLLFYHFISSDLWVAGLAVGLAIALMMWTKNLHPPAASNPIIVYLSGVGFKFLLFPNLIGCLILIVVAVIFNKWILKKDYPKFWI